MKTQAAIPNVEACLQAMPWNHKIACKQAPTSITA
jgi:hypothetical protein